VSPGAGGAAGREPDDGALDLLSRGSVEILGLLPRSSNYTFLARIREPGTAAGGDDDAQGTLAVYKPRRGEIPLWDFPEGTLGRREGAAYLLARALGWPFVPPTVWRQGPEGAGSVQLFVPHDPEEHYFTLADDAARADELRRVAAFDVVANNADRKGGHCLLADDGRIAAIDHGVCFGVEPKLRSVIWEFAGEPLPDDVCGDVERVAGELRNAPLRDRMREMLSGAEIAATAARAERLVAAGRFPRPGPGRPYPWPPV
jgi:Phosphatidylinositol 3- and 4-kinase